MFILQRNQGAGFQNTAYTHKCRTPSPPLLPSFHIYLLPNHRSTPLTYLARNATVPDHQVHRAIGTRGRARDKAVRMVLAPSLPLLLQPSSGDASTHFVLGLVRDAYDA